MHTIERRSIFESNAERDLFSDRIWFTQQIDPRFPVFGSDLQMIDDAASVDM